MTFVMPLVIANANTCPFVPTPALHSSSEPFVPAGAAAPTQKTPTSAVAATATAYAAARLPRPLIVMHPFPCREKSPVRAQILCVLQHFRQEKRGPACAG